MSVSEESVQAPKRFGSGVQRMQRSGATPNERSWNPVTGVPRTGAQRSGSPDRAASSPTRSVDSYSAPKPYTPHRSRASVQPEGAQDMSRADPQWARNEGHHTRMQANLYAGKGVRRTPFENGNTHMEPGSGCLPKQKVALGSEAHEMSAEFIQSCRDHLNSSSMKLSIQSPADRHHAREAEDPKFKQCPAEKAVSAGASSGDIAKQQKPRCWNDTQQHLDNVEGMTAEPNSPSSRSRCKLIDSSQAQAAMTVDSNITAAEGQEFLENYYKNAYGRSMKLGRQSSEPPRPVEKKIPFMKKSLQGNDWAQDESHGAIVPCLSPDIIRKCETHGNDKLHKKVGEFSNGCSDFTRRQNVLQQGAAASPAHGGEKYGQKYGSDPHKANLAHFRVEQYCDSPMRRSASVPAGRRNPVLGEGVHNEPNSGRIKVEASAVAQAGLTTRQLATGASVRTCAVGDKPEPFARGRKVDHGETPHMTSVLQNTVAKDVDRMRTFREVHDKPFADLCRSFQKIRDANVKEADRIRVEVNPHVSHNVASLLRHSPRSQSCDAEQLTIKPRSSSREPFSPNLQVLSSSRERFAPNMQAPAGVMSSRCQSPRLQSPGRLSTLSQNSLDIRDALRWVC